MKNRIYIKQWLELKPYSKQTLTDNYYLNLSNKIKKVLLEPDSFILQRFIGEFEIDLLSCLLVSYFEDIISETNIWKTFTHIHREHYKKILPFYESDNYFEDEINLQDVSFLIWYFLNTIQEEKFISPFNDFIIQIASKVMVILDEEYEYAPENNFLKTFYTLNETETDYYIVRNLIDNLLFKTYLFFTDTAKELAERENSIIEEGKDEHLLHYLQETLDAYLHSAHTRLIGLKGKEWAAHLLGKKHPLYADLLTMSQRISGFFIYKGQDETDIFIEHIASGKKFKLTKKSFDHSHLLNTTDTIMYLGIVKWQNEWWFSGVYFQNEFNANLVMDEKNSMKSRMQADFLNQNKKEIMETLEMQRKAFLGYNNGSPVAFLPGNKIEQFVKGYTEYFNTTLNLSEAQMKEAREWTRKDGFFGDNDKPDIDFEEKGDNGLVFFNPKSGVEIAMNFNDILPFNNNPWYNPGENQDEVLGLFISDEISKELAEYCLEHAKNKMPFFKSGPGKLYLKDIDFLLRFWKRGYYFSKPTITLIGQAHDDFRL
ncbi:MAG: DUF3843 family protein [Prolixibacteraceae bacterium]|nr:DUF3843 family protein [Prolixibacteraceae bacterium]